MCEAGGGYCVVWDRRGFVCWSQLHHPSVFLWLWSQQHILFCHYLSALGIHLPNVANWLLKGVTHSGLVFGKRIHGGLTKRAILRHKWSCLREATRRGFSLQWGVTPLRCWCEHVLSLIRKKRPPNRYRDQCFWLKLNGGLRQMKR